MKLSEEFKEWAIQCHAKTNHYYDETLNNTYSFHLKMAVLVGEEFKHLLPEWTDLLDGKPHVGSIPVWQDIVEPALWGHDLTEDTRQNYNAILNRSNVYVAEICRAVTNYSRGRNRLERMPDWLYKEIVDTPFAVFVKLCDRIANVRYSVMMRSKMLKVYQEEHFHFKVMLRFNNTLNPMWELLDNLLYK
jgi:hypothetical protein